MATAAMKGAFRAQGMELKDEACGALATRVGIALGIDAEELAEEYEVFHINRGETGNVVTPALIESFRKHLQDRNAKARAKVAGARSKSWHTYSKHDLDDVVFSTKAFSPPPTAGRAPEKKAGDFAIRSAFPRQKRSADVAELQTSAASKFAQRTQSGKVVTSLAIAAEDKASGRDEGAAAAPSAEAVPWRSVRAGVSSVVRGPGQSVRFMVDTLEGKAKFLEDRIVRFIDAVERDLDIPASNAIHRIANEPTVVVGRVCSDALEGGGRINEASILLEGSMKHSRGLRARVDTSKLGSLSLFPGQVVAVEALNPSGHCLTALSLLTGLPGSLPRTPAGTGGRASTPAPADAADDAKKEERTKPRRVVVAVGPFTTTSDLSFEPLKALVAKLAADPPSSVILCGPFVDRGHPLIREGTVDVDFDDIFAACLACCASLPDDVAVLAVPSARDAHHDPLFPQPPFASEAVPSSAKDRVVCLTNPATIDCGGLAVGTTSHDILKHLSGLELFRSTTPSDRMGRLASHVLQQRSYYPLYPPSPGSCLDCTVAREHGGLDVAEALDVLVLPSDLTPFCKAVPVGARVHTKTGHKSVFAEAMAERSGAKEAKCVCVNPGRLTRMATGGSYAVLTIDGDGALDKAEIVKI